MVPDDSIEQSFKILEATYFLIGDKYIGWTIPKNLIYFTNKSSRKSIVLGDEVKSMQFNILRVKLKRSKWLRIPLYSKNYRLNLKTTSIID